jgi:peptidoglycan/xylan/chitin deacetylase (PgdA/CDA1 family)
MRANTTINRSRPEGSVLPSPVSTSFIPVLLYHSIRDAAFPGLERFTVSVPAFADHVKVLSSCRERGATALLISELAEVLRGECPAPARPFAVTFDDGYDDNLPAILALADAGIPSTIYVTAGLVGKRGMLDTDQIRDLAMHPMVEVGAHTVSHLRLDELSRPEIEHELQGARQYLQEITGGPIASVAYPHGAHDRRVLAEVRRAGYSSGAAVKNALSRPGDDPFAIARWSVLDSHSPQDIARVLDGAISVVGSREHLRTRGFRVVRRMRRRLGIVTGRARLLPNVTAEPRLRGRGRTA